MEIFIQVFSIIIICTLGARQGWSTASEPSRPGDFCHPVTNPCSTASNTVCAIDSNYDFTCRCVKGSFADTANRKCILAPKPGDSCDPEASVSPCSSISSSSCEPIPNSSTHACTCVDGFVQLPDKCLSPPTLPGEECHPTQAPCPPKIDCTCKYEFTNDACVCNGDLITDYWLKRCIQNPERPGDPCDVNWAPCIGIQFTHCDFYDYSSTGPEYVCRCVSGFVTDFVEGICWRIPERPGEFCNKTHTPCEGLDNTRCVINPTNSSQMYCECLDELVTDVKGGRCLARPSKPGGNCDADLTPCEFGPYMECVGTSNGTCKCVGESVEHLDGSRCLKMPQKVGDECLPVLATCSKINGTDCKRSNVSAGEYGCLCQDGLVTDITSTRCVKESGLGGSDTPDSGTPFWIYVLYALLGLLVLIIGLTSGIAIRNRSKLRAAQIEYKHKCEELQEKLKARPELPLISEDGGVQAQAFAYEKEKHEISVDQIEFGTEVLGAGEFGTVVKGVYNEGNRGAREVALKMCKAGHPDSQDSFVIELKILSYIGRHENVIEFVGSLTEGRVEPVIVLEYCEHKSLLDVLQKNRSYYLDQVIQDEVHPEFKGVPLPKSYRSTWTICTTDLLRAATQIANGMVYLSVEKKIIHGDLFTKNVLINGRGVAKITDFGLARRFAYKNVAPYVRVVEGWTVAPHLLPPEAKQIPVKLSSKLDVWMFGILMWEIFMLGESQNCAASADSLTKPDRATSSLFRIMRKCWATEAQNRGDFEELRTELIQILGAGRTNLSEGFDLTIKFTS